MSEMWRPLMVLVIVALVLLMLAARLGWLR
jgi:hypothetical protein